MNYDAPTFDTFDPEIAAAMIKMNAKIGGLPAFLGASLDRYEPGKLFASMEVGEQHLTPMGAIHGGVMAGFVDHVLGCVLYPLMKKGQWAATTEFKLNYLAAVKAGRLEAESSVISFGRRAAVVRVEVANGPRLCCTAQGTLIVSTPPLAKVS
jgi:1,4-dihydroxy-2-naphthoyl-CoA hydrolase